MKKTALALGLGLCLVALALGCATKDAPSEKPEREIFYHPENCPVASIEVTPELSSDETVTIGSGREVVLKAVALGQRGQAISAALTWSLRYPDAEDETVSGHGHTISPRGANTAVFKADGLAPGLFAVVVQDRSCNQFNNDKTQYPEGGAWINVYNRPEDDVACGQLRATYGDGVDRMGDKILASEKVTLVAEISSRRKLKRDHRVRFFINHKAYPWPRPIYYESTVTPAPGMEVGNMAFLPIFLVPGDWTVSYELLKNGEVVCASRTEKFRAR